MAAVLPVEGGQPGVILRLEEIEVALLRSLTAQMVDLVRPDEKDHEDPLAAIIGIDPNAAPSDDPALRRLLPDALTDDEEAAAEFRRFTERDLRRTKVGHAQQVDDDLANCGGTVSVTGDRIGPWLGFLNDARLVIGTRLEITEENHDELVELPDDDPRAPLVGLYGWLTYLQESLVQSLLEPGE